MRQRARSGKGTTRRAAGDREPSGLPRDLAVFPGSASGIASQSEVSLPAERSGQREPGVSPAPATSLDGPAPTARPIDVCLLCVHPLLSTEFRRVLADTHFRVAYQRLEAGRVGSSEQWSVPPASVHIVEAHANVQATMGIIRRVLSEGPGTRVLVVKEEFPDKDAYPLLSAGARGLLRYSEVESQLARALSVIAGGGFWVPRLLLSGFVGSVLTSRPVRSGQLAQGLSPREAEVLDLLLRNLSNKEIAKELKISSRTAKFHVSNLLAKHGVQRRADLILLAHAPALR